MRRVGRGACEGGRWLSAVKKTTMPPERRPLTFADYQSWEDEQRWELIDGQPYAMSSPSSLHQMLSIAFTVRLAPYFSGAPCRLLYAPLDVKLSDYDVVQPDLLVVCDAGQIRPTHVEGAPRLVIEILSPSTQRHDRVRKLNLYSAAGVGEYWLVTPHPFMVEVLHNVQGCFSNVGAYTENGQLRSPSFPQVQLDLNEIFQSLPPQPPLDEVREGVPPYATTP